MAEYTILEEIGRGAMGVVYRARQERLQREVALKLLNAEQAGDAASLERFRREAREQAKLVHPNVVRVLDAGVLEGQLFIAMELLAGDSLLGHVKKHGPTPLKVAAAWIAQAADALAYVHSRGLHHRDVKPGNLFVVGANDVKLMDFGLARSVHSARLTEPGVMVGSFRYLAPEVLTGDGAGPEVDVYALALTLHELLFAKPWCGVMGAGELVGAIRGGRAAAIVRETPALPEWLVKLQVQALAVDPRERPEAASYRNGLLAGLAEKPARPSGSCPTGKKRKRRRSHAGVAIGAFAVLLFLGAMERNPPAPTASRAVASPTVASAAPSAMPPASPALPVSLLYQTLEPEVRARLARGGLAAAETVSLCRARTRLDLGRDPEVWRYWLALSEWLERPARSGPLTPPPSSGTHVDAVFGTVDGLLAVDLPGWLGQTADRKMFEDLVKSLAKDSSRGTHWLGLSRLLELEGRTEPARLARMVGVRRLVVPQAGHWKPWMLDVLVRGLAEDPSTFEKMWWSLGDLDSICGRGWEVVRVQLGEREPALVTRLLEEGVRRGPCADKAALALARMRR